MKVAVVGLGFMGEFYVRILADLVGPGNVIAVEIDDSRRERIGSDYGVDVLRDWDQAVGRADAVVIALPDHLHVKPTTAFLRSGAYVLVEKPLATTVSDSHRILEAQVAPGKLMVGHLLRFDHRLQELKRRLHSGEFGVLRYVRIWRANPTSVAQRVGDRVSVSAFLGVHDLDILLWLTGQGIKSATAEGKKVFGNHWDLSVAYLELTDGTSALMENHWLIHPDAQRSALAGIQLFGESGMALLDLSTQELELVTDHNPRSKRVDTHNWTFDATVSGGNLRRQVEAFIEAARHGEQVPVSGEEGLRAVQAVELVEEALARRD